MKLSFTIDQDTYHVPEEISLEIFERAIVWDIEDFKNIKPFIATIIGCSINTLNQLDDDVFHFITGVCIYKINVDDAEVVNEINNHKLRNFEDFTFGEWVDLDTYMSKSATQNVTKIASILYGVTENECKDWDIKQVWGAIVDSNKWRQYVYKEYDEFFELNEISEEESEEEASEANIQLMWYQAIMILANDKFIDIHKVVERPYREALNYLTWKKAQVAKQKLEILKQKHDISRRRK